MKKVPNVFERDWEGNRSQVLPVLHNGADVAWVLTGEGLPTVKWDGSAVMWDGRALWVRYDRKPNKKKGGALPPAPEGFQPCEPEPDPKTGHWPGWIPAEGNPAAKWHLEALANYQKHYQLNPKSGVTLEACGPHHQSNPYGLDRGFLFKHGADPIPHLHGRRFDNAEDLFTYLKAFLVEFRFGRAPMEHQTAIEGVVWHHPDGRMAKALASDLGLTWQAKDRQALR